MKTIYKYRLPADLRMGHVMMPPGAVPLSVGQQGNDIQCWALVNRDAMPSVMRRIVGVGTGHPMPKGEGRFIGTVQLDNGLVFHFFDMGEDS